jgi:hypothetical protein
VATVTPDIRGSSKRHRKKKLDDRLTQFALILSFQFQVPLQVVEAMPYEDFALYWEWWTLQNGSDLYYTRQDYQIAQLTAVCANAFGGSAKADDYLVRFQTAEQLEEKASIRNMIAGATFAKPKG